MAETTSNPARAARRRPPGRPRRHRPHGTRAELLAAWANDKRITIVPISEAKARDAAANDATQEELFALLRGSLWRRDWFDDSEPIRVPSEFFGREQYVDALRAKTMDAGGPCHPPRRSRSWEALALAHGISGGHPWLLRKLGSAVHRSFDDRPAVRTVTKGDVDRVFQRTKREFYSHIDWILGHLKLVAPEEYALLRDIRSSGTCLRSTSTASG